MSTTTTPAASLRRPRATAAVRERLRTLPLPAPELAAVLLLAAALYLWSLDRNGWANTYYTATVRSMASSWHDFLYASFDRSGVMTVDKPPLALWVQAASVRVFGLSSWSILVPQALMGVASVALVHDLVRRRFGRAAGFTAALVLATTPITVAISRHNNPDALVVLCSVGALWATLRALEDGRTRWLLIAGACIGLGFETKMGTALLVLPALAAAYLWVAPRGRLRSFGQLLGGGAVMVAVGLAWPVLVWLTPAANRPWVSGTSDNSIWSLILDYNGVGRLDGQAGGPAGAAGGPGGGGGAGGVFGGPTGPLRLLDASLGGQSGWLLGLGLAAGVALLVVTRLRRSDPRTGFAIAAGGALLTTAVAFSYAKGIFHPYYVSMLAPFVAIMAGAGAGLALRTTLTARIVAPALIVAGIASELVVLHRDATDLSWAPTALIVLGGAAAAGAAVKLPARARGAVLAVALGALLMAPATWAVQTLGHATSGTFPAGGPVTQGFGGPGGFGGGRAGGARFGTPPQRGAMPGFAPNAAGAPPAGAGAAPGTAGAPGAGGGPGGFGGDSTQVTAAVTYAKAHGGGTVAVSSQQGASSSIIQQGADVAALGGFSGRESEVSASWLAGAVSDGRVRFVLTDSNGGGMRNDGRVGSSQLMAAVQKACTQTSTTGLYDCSGKATALAAAG